jgi:hypothetical protein
VLLVTSDYYLLHKNHTYGRYLTHTFLADFCLRTVLRNSTRKAVTNVLMSLSACLVLAFNRPNQLSRLAVIAVLNSHHPPTAFDAQTFLFPFYISALAMSPFLSVAFIEFMCNCVRDCPQCEREIRGKQKFAVQPSAK